MGETIHSVSRLLMQNNQSFFSIITEELTAFGITIPQAIVLDQVKGSPKTIGEISKAIGLSYSTVSGIIDRLERNGIVARRRDEKDRRVVWVSLIDNLKELSEKYPILHEEYFPKLFEDLFQSITKEEMELIQRALELLQESLGRHHKQHHERKGSE